MRRLFFRWAAAALLAGALMIPAAEAAQLQIDDRIVEPSAAWTEEGTPYVTLAALCQAADGYTLSWNGTAAALTAEDLELTATPGALYVEVNGRALYVEHGVQVRDGRIALPLEVLAEAGWAWSVDSQAAPSTSSQVSWRPAASASYPAEDLYWLSRIISAESRGEPLLGQIAVGNVILNRVESSQYPDTVEGVVFDTKYGVQFQPVSNGTIYDAPASSSLVAAKLCLEGTDVVCESLYFFSPALSAGRWIVSNATYYTTIGGHQFYV